MGFEVCSVLTEGYAMSTNTAMFSAAAACPCQVLPQPLITASCYLPPRTVVLSCLEYNGAWYTMKTITGSRTL